MSNSLIPSRAEKEMEMHGRHRVSRMFRFVLSFTAVFTVALGSSCKKTNSGQTGGNGVHATFNSAGASAALPGTPSQFYTPANAVFKVTYTDNTVRMDLETLKRTLRSVSRDGRVMVFDASAPQLQNI